MRRFRRLAPQRALPAGPQRRPAARAERGQAIVIIAMAMIGLLAFIGLTVDAGILYIGVGHLRRAVDAAALAASAQFREGRTVDDLTASAKQVVHLNGVDPTTLELWMCDKDKSRNDPLDAATHHDPALCPAPNQPWRKLIRIRAATMVRFAFLTIIGFHDTEISAQAVSEAASVDVVLVIDTSESMASGDEVYPADDPATCNAVDTGDGFPGECHPFQEVKQAAFNFAERLNYPYDRVAIVSFALTPTVVLPITTTFANATDQKAEIQSRILALQVSPARKAGDPGCATGQPGSDVSGCTSTSIGGGLKLAGNQFGLAPIRQESVWVVILLTDGAANASESDASIIPPTLNKFCPSSVWNFPYCRDNNLVSRHTILTPTIWITGAPSSGIQGIPGHTRPFNLDSTWNAYVDPNTGMQTNNPYDDYDTDDFAHDMADFVACAPTYAEAAVWCRDTLNYIKNEGGQGAILYAIGLGQYVVKNKGDSLLRYVSNVGLDGDPDPHISSSNPDPCAVIPAFTTLTPGNDSYNCGNYYFSESGTGLNAVFESIASRVFTRLTQ